MAAALATPDLVVHVGTRAPWSDRASAADGVLYRAKPGEPDPPIREAAWLAGRPGLRLLYGDGAEYCVRADAREVWVTWPASLAFEDAMVHFVGPVLGFILRRLGVLTLHASGAVIGAYAAAFCGESGAGKSTLAAALAAVGHAALADDVLALREVNSTMMAYPAYDHLRVWDDSANAIVGPGHDLPWLTPSWDKRAFTLSALGYPIARAPAPLGWIFLLAPRSRDDSAPRVEPLRAAEAFVPLVANTAANYLLSPEMRAKEFALLARLLACTPVLRLVPHEDPARLAELVSCVLETTGA